MSSQNRRFRSTVKAGYNLIESASIPEAFWGSRRVVANSEADARPSGSSATELSPAQRKPARGFQEAGHRLLRAGLGVDAHQRLGAAGAQQQPGLGGVWLGGGFRIVQVKLDAVEGVLAQDRHSGKDRVAGLERFGAGDDAIDNDSGDVQVDAAVLVLAVFGLEIGDELAQCLALLRHHVGQEKRIKQAIALRQVALEADAARLLAAHHDLPLQHVVADEFEADAVLDQLAAVLGADSVQHLGGVEGAGDGARPALALEYPTQQDGKDLVRIDELAVL